MFAALLLLSACAEGVLVAHVAKQVPIPGEEKAESPGIFKIGNPYKIKGDRFVPKETYSFTQTGIASWYGPNFHGKKTANGEIFDKYELTAAHKTLQMPSIVRVTNLQNGRSLIVRVNDRGPFAKGRVIDMSQRSAELLGFRNQGTAKVRVEVLPDESRMVARAAKQGYDTTGMEIAMNEDRLRHVKAAPQSAQPSEAIKTAAAPPKSKPQFMPPKQLNIAGHIDQGRFMPDPVVHQLPVEKTDIFVQAGSFSSENNAAKLAERLSQIDTTTVQTVLVNGRQFHRVRMGPLRDVAQADALLSELSQSGLASAEIVVD